MHAAIIQVDRKEVTDYEIFDDFLSLSGYQK